MHIAIDAHMVGEQETGNETYILNLTRALLRRTALDPKGFSWDTGPALEANATSSRPASSAAVAGGRERPRRFGATPRFLLLTTHPELLRAALPDLPGHVAIAPVRPATALIRIPVSIPLTALRHHVDLLHVTYHAPPLAPCPTVVTIHDISFEHYPDFFSPRDLLILKTLVPWSARHAARIITVSQHARDEIAYRYGVARDRIVVTYEAASGDEFRPVECQETLNAVRRKYGIGDGQFVLALGNLQPRKNIARLVEAFGRLGETRGQSSDSAASIGRADPDHRSANNNGERQSAAALLSSRRMLAPSWSLVIAGKAQWRESEVYNTVRSTGLEDRVIFPGYVDAADLPALYSAASVFVYPSLYEGFGLPPLEAMACGTPVISSNAASLPEVIGDAAVAVSPTDTEALAQALADVLTNPDLRADLAARGRRRAAQFSWDRCAGETLAVYQEAISVVRSRL